MSEESSTLCYRQANPADAPQISTCLFPALESAFIYFAQSEVKQARNLLTHFISKKSNQYSFENCRTLEVDAKIVAAACVYPGALLHELRRPVLDYIYATSGWRPEIEAETHSGEIYLDSIGVLPECRGRGFGKLLLQNLLKEYSRHGLPIGLLVDETNATAYKLYTRLGFRFVGSRSFMNAPMLHLQYLPEGKAHIPAEKN